MARNYKIKAARAERDLTQKALAEAVGISRQTMNAIEKGDYNPTIKLCGSICRVLGKSVDELFGEEEPTMDEGKIRYCPRCRALSTGERCPRCGNAELTEPTADELCFLTQQPYLWSEMLADVLRQNDIPVFTQNYLGAGMTSKIGSMMEQVSFYVPYSRFSEADDLVKTLFSDQMAEENSES